MSLIDKPLRLNSNIMWKVTTEPAVEPVTVADVKTYAVIETDDDDDLIENMIIGVRRMAEDWTGKSFITRTITAFLDYWPTNRDWIILPSPPLIDVTGIYTVDEDDTATEYSSSYYYVHAANRFGKVVIKHGSTPPYTNNRCTGGIKIIYTAGFGTSASDVPTDIKLGLQEWITFAYENRIMSRVPPDDAMPFLGSWQTKKV